PEVAAELAVGDGEIDLRDEDPGRLGAQNIGPSAGRAQLVMTEHARVLVEQPELARAGRRDVAGGIRQQEIPVLLEDQLGRGEGADLARDAFVAEQLRAGDGRQLDVSPTGAALGPPGARSRHGPGDAPLSRCGAEPLTRPAGRGPATGLPVPRP